MIKKKAIQFQNPDSQETAIFTDFLLNRYLPEKFVQPILHLKK